MAQKLIFHIDEIATMNKRNVLIEKKKQRSLVSHKKKEEQLDQK